MAPKSDERPPTLTYVPARKRTGPSAGDVILNVVIAIGCALLAMVIGILLLGIVMDDFEGPGVPVYLYTGVPLLGATALWLAWKAISLIVALFRPWPETAEEVDPSSIGAVVEMRDRR